LLAVLARKDLKDSKGKLDRQGRKDSLGRKGLRVPLD
jgi:hypothetical protein